jgi:nitrogen-specific signal transduction histidine kinase
MQSGNTEPKLLNILQSFNAISERITAYREDRGQLLRTILDLTVSMPFVSYASILLLDGEQRQFDTVATCGDCPFDFDLKVVLYISKLLKHHNFHTGQKLAFQALVDESEWRVLKTEEQRCLKNLIFFPLVIEQKIIGVACVCRADVGLDILESEKFALWANFISLAIEKSSEYEQTRARLEITREEFWRSQKQRTRSEKLSSLAEIARSVAHTIRNPVTIIGGLSRRLGRDLPDDDPKRLEFQMIMSEASRLEKIVKEFNRFFTIEQMSFKYEDVNRIVEVVLE